MLRIYILSTALTASENMHICFSQTFYFPAHKYESASCTYKPTVQSLFGLLHAGIIYQYMNSLSIMPSYGKL